MRITLIIFIFLVALFMPDLEYHAQEGHGDVMYRARNIHSGNLIRVTYHNFGMMGSKSGDNSLTYAGEWPINSGMVQMGNASSFVSSEIKIPTLDPDTQDTVLVSVTPVIFCEGWDPAMFSHDSLGNFLGFEPLPGYFNTDNEEVLYRSAMSHIPITWPVYWPDKMADSHDPGWRGSWNGYFGKNVKNSDQESFHVLDDYQYKKRLKSLKLPHPIESEPDRGGVGLRKELRGLQWSNPDAEDCIFWIYKITNIGELDLNKTVFGLNVGASMGALVEAHTDWADDAATFYRDIGLTVNYDWDNIGTQGYAPVPWAGFAFLESPGNPYDGIDNDGDGMAYGDGVIITPSLFTRTYHEGDDIVTIDYESDRYMRTVIPIPAEGITVTVNDTVYEMKPDSLLIEIERNGIDDNLNGLIDEADGAELTETQEHYYLYIKDPLYNNKDYLAVDYVSGVGLDNPMIDERRDDKIDNDGDWNPALDDVGMDGKEATGDPGEGDLQPTYGSDKLPGEPNLDAVDVSESDQIGLTSFVFYEYGTVVYSNDQQMWDVSRPGFFDSRLENVDADYVFSCGYFPLKPKQTESFSVAMVYGWDETDIIRNKETVQKIYDANYNFAKAPDLPALRAVAGDNKVTLYWDSKSEESVDRYLAKYGLGYDFEGYKIYRSNDPGFDDAGMITDGFGYERFKKPIAVYDKIDSVYGFFPNSFGTGVEFYLGNESGLVHTYIDSPVVNGMRYYYAVTAYDRGYAHLNITPSETRKYVTIDATGEVKTGQNVAVVTPTGPALGYVLPEFEFATQQTGGFITSGIVNLRYLEPELLKKDEQYQLQFLDWGMDKRDNDGDGLIDMADDDEWLQMETSGMVLNNISNENAPQLIDTVWFQEYRLIDSLWVPIKDMYQDADKNSRTLRATLNGIEFFIYNPVWGVVNKIYEEQADIINGIKWSANIDPYLSYNMIFEIFDQSRYQKGMYYPRQYRFVFYDELINESMALVIPWRRGNREEIIDPQRVNFRVYDLLTGEEVPFGFRENPDDASPSVIPAGFFSAQDELWFTETLANDSTVLTYYLINETEDDSVDFINYYNRYLGAGDTLYLFPDMPFLSKTTYQFTIRGNEVNPAMAKNMLNKIRVVPNPYAGTAVWEPENPYTNGRGERRIQFIHLPQKCTIRIYAIDGTLIRTLHHNAEATDGSENWDLLTKDNMDISYGVYLYHVDAPGIGEHMGKIFIIK
jgi:hypothetical protein